MPLALVKDLVSRVTIAEAVRTGPTSKARCLGKLIEELGVSSTKAVAATRQSTDRIVAFRD